MELNSMEVTSKSVHFGLFAGVAINQPKIYAQHNWLASNKFIFVAEQIISSLYFGPIFERIRFGIRHKLKSQRANDFIK